MAFPWLSRSRMIAYLDLPTRDRKEIHEALEERLSNVIQKWLEEKVDPDLPTILTAHASIQGATFGAERSVMLGKDLVLPGSLVRDKRLDYVALGHIHKPQNLNPKGEMPPIIYPGSIERVDFGEAGDQKYFVIAEVERGQTEVEWRELKNIRPFIDRHLVLESKENLTQQILDALPDPEQIREAIVRLVLEYPRAWHPLIDENVLEEHREAAFEFHLNRRPIMENRIRLPEDQTLGSLSPLELLSEFWKANHTPPEEQEALNTLAEEVIAKTRDDD
jgi:exonuclease SbcD